MTKQIRLYYSGSFYDTAEVPDDWEWDGTIAHALTVSDLPYDHTGELIDVDVVSDE